jgi:uncharacterized repeat protein (TIGR01451 family)
MPEDPLIGRQLANFRIERLIKRGGMARVYYGQDVKLDRPVAIKVIDFQYRDDPTYAERFVREARAVAAWRHENIVQVYYADDQQGLYYFCMEYIDGLDLGELLLQHARSGELMPHAEVLRIGRAIARALDYAHRKGVIHRDVKPSNVMVAQDDRVVLTDFGLALDVHRGTVGEAFGSARYIAPEQAKRSANAVPQSDLYSLGVILYQMLTGVVPFDDPSPTSVAIQHLTASPPSPRASNPSLNAEVEAVLLKALSKAPKDRYQTGAELMDALEQALSIRQTGPDGQGTSTEPDLPRAHPVTPDMLRLSEVDTPQAATERTTITGPVDLSPAPADATAFLVHPAPDALPGPPRPMPAKTRGRWVFYVLLTLFILGIVVVASAVVLYATNEDVRKLVGQVLSGAAVLPEPSLSPLASVEPTAFESPLGATTTASVAVTVTQATAPSPTPEPTSMPVVQISVSAAPDLVSRNDRLGYTIRVISKGQPAFHVVVTDIIPAGTRYVEGSATEGVELVGERVLRWEKPAMEPDREYLFAFQVTVLADDAVVNDQYGAQWEGGVGVLGPPVITSVDASGIEIYMPLILCNVQ